MKSLRAAANTMYMLCKYIDAWELKLLRLSKPLITRSSYRIAILENQLLMIAVLVR